MSAVRINLLPHREERRKQRKQAFMAIIGLVAATGVVAVLAGGMYNDGLIEKQEARNHLLRTENKKLDKQIEEIYAMVKPGTPIFILP